MLYRWPHGRVIRTIGFVMVALVTMDLIYDGVLGQLEAYNQALENAGGDSGQQSATRPLIYLVIFSILASISFFGGIFAVGFYPKSAQFLIEVEAEMAKVTWPTRPELIRSTILISVLSVILSMMIVGVDYINRVFCDWVNTFGGTV